MTKALLQRRWLRDFSSPRQVYVPESKAVPSRMCEGFDLRANGTYCQIGTGENDATIESEGTWHLDDDGLLTLSPNEASGIERKMQVVEADQDKLVVEE